MNTSVTMTDKIIYRYINWLTCKCKSLIEKSSYVFWVDGSINPEFNYCKKCVVFKARHERNRAKKDRDCISVGGGYGSDEDSTSFCNGCGEALDHNLTDCGFDSEFEHFIEVGELSEEMSELSAFELLRLFSFYGCDRDDEIIKLYNSLNNTSLHKGGCSTHEKETDGDSSHVNVS